MSLDVKRFAAPVWRAQPVDAATGDKRMFQSAREREGAQAPESLRPRGASDEVDYAHRHFVNLIAAAFLLCLAVLMVWTLKAMDSQESLRKCAASGRKDCIQIAAPPRGMVQAVR